MACFSASMPYAVPKMKPIVYTLSTLICLFGVISCERHSWEDVKEVNPENGKEEVIVEKGTKRLFGH